MWKRKNKKNNIKEVIEIKELEKIKFDIDYKEINFEMAFDSTSVSAATVDQMLARALQTNNIEVQRLLQEQEREYKRKIDELESMVSGLGLNNIVTEFSCQVIDPNVNCIESLEIIKSLPEFSGNQSAYVSWREAAHNSMKLYIIGSSRYFAALTILRNKITQHANDVLTNHGTVLNFEAIMARLDFAYADKRPVHVIEQELSILRQGSLRLIDFYNEVNKKLTLLTNKTIMTHGSSSPVTIELNNINRRNALRVFITGLNGQLSQILFSLNPQDLPNALAKAQELESNHIRSNFALQFAQHKNENKNNGNDRNHNNLRFPKINQTQRPTQHQRRNDYRQLPQLFEPMVLGSSQNRPIPQQQTQNPFKQVDRNFNNNSYAPRWQKPNFNTYNNNTRPLYKRERESAQHSIQPPPVKFERVNNLNENENFLGEKWDYPTYEEE